MCIGRLEGITSEYGLRANTAHEILCRAILCGHETSLNGDGTTRMTAVLAVKQEPKDVSTSSLQHQQGRRAH